jgi:hypothetical protein
VTETVLADRPYLHGGEIWRPMNFAFAWSILMKIFPDNREVATPHWNDLRSLYSEVQRLRTQLRVLMSDKAADPHLQASEVTQPSPSCSCSSRSRLC